MVRKQREPRKNRINFHSMADQNESICAWRLFKIPKRHGRKFLPAQT